MVCRYGIETIFSRGYYIAEIMDCGFGLISRVTFILRRSEVITTIGTPSFLYNILDIIKHILGVWILKIDRILKQRVLRIRYVS